MPTPSTELTPEMLAAAVGIVLTVAGMYVPKFNEWFASLDPTVQRLGMGLATIALAAGAVVLSCQAVIVFVTCTQVSIVSVAWSVLLALIANQGIWQVLPRPRAVRMAIARRRARS